MSATIPATISHNFVLSEIENADVNEDEALCSPDVEVVHNNVTLKFHLKITLKDPPEQTKDKIGLYVMYKDGPQAKVRLEYRFFVTNGSGSIPIGRQAAEVKEFDISEGWGLPNVLPRSVKALKDDGYLSTDGKLLHVTAELSIPVTAFVRPPPPIFASLNHKFDVQELVNADTGSIIQAPVVSVAHNNVKLDFKLFALIADTGNSRIGFYVQYLKGPKTELVMDIELIVVKGRKRNSMAHGYGDKFEMGKHGRGSSKVPRTVEALRAGGYLSLDDKLHVIAELSIPQSAFAVPEEKPAFVQVDLLGFHLFQELTSPADTTSPTSNRVELVSSDDTHLWSHKEVLSCASDVFKDLFDKNRPIETKLDCFKKGVLEFDDLSGEALTQMLHFVYLRQTGKEFEKFALEIVPVADRFLIKGLKEACERCLIEGMDLMAIDHLCRCLDGSFTFNLPALTAACTETLPRFIQHNDDIDQKHLVSLIDLAQQHDLGSLKSACEQKLAHIMDNTHDRAVFLALLSLARERQMELLVTHCVRWFKNKFDVLKADGFVRFLMNDDGENGQDILEFLLESVVTLLPLP